jgi:Trp operon repressor
MQDWYDLLQQIKKRPTLYLSRRSIFDLQSFYKGYYVARQLLNLPATEQEREFDNFSEWLQKKYEINTRQSWAMLILFNSHDERDALDNFFELFEEFIEQRKVPENSQEIELEEE